MHTEDNFHLSGIKLSDSLSTTFKLRYRANYDFIYNMYDQMREMGEAYNAGIEFIRDRSRYDTMCSILGDTPLSDREIRTLAFTLREFGVINF